MTAVKTEIGANEAAHDAPFTPTASVPKSTVQEAIDYLAAQISANTEAWGTITGTLSDQTDLQAALDAKLNASLASAFGLQLLDDADAATARTTLGLGTLATQSGTFSGTSSGTNTGDQNLFRTIAVSGQSDVVADSTTDTLTLAAGTDIGITTNDGTDTITISYTGSGVSDGDKGDVTVTGGGTTWTVDNDTITNAKLSNMAASTLKGRATGSTGDPEDITIGNGFHLSGTTLSALGTKNVLINGCFRINRRAVTTNADDTYAHDRWIVLTQTGTVAASTQTLVENGTANMMRVTQSQASAQRFGVEQIVEATNTYPLRGQAVTLSARVRCSASTTLRFAILEWTGTADVVTSDVVNDWTSGTFTAGNFFLGSNLTVTATGSQALTANTLASISLTGTLGSSVNNLIVLFWTDSTQAQNVTLDIGNAQLEQGSVATSFEQRSRALEANLAGRYFQKLFGENANDFLFQGSATGAGISIGTTFALSPPMRTAPTGAIFGTFTLTNSSVIQIVATSSTSFSVNNGATSGVGLVQVLSVNTTTYMTFAAEL